MALAGGGRDRRLGMVVTRQASAVLDIEVALSDGWQEHDAPVIARACRLIKGQFPDIEDANRDFAAIARCARVGRRLVYDERFRARENDLERTRRAMRVLYTRPRRRNETAATRLQLVAAAAVERAAG